MVCVFSQRDGLHGEGGAASPDPAAAPTVWPRRADCRVSRQPRIRGDT